jgi:hypothetical protein
LLLPPMVAYVARALDRLLDVKKSGRESELQRKPSVEDKLAHELSSYRSGTP